jgi:hypothetical protein
VRDWSNKCIISVDLVPQLTPSTPLGPGVDYLGIVGVKNAVVLTKEEMNIIEKDDIVGQMNGAAKAEVLEIRPGVETLNDEQGVTIHDDKVVFTKKLLGERRLCVVKEAIRSNYETIYRYSLQHGTGSDEARKEMQILLENWLEER